MGKNKINTLKIVTFFQNLMLGSNINVNDCYNGI